MMIKMAIAMLVVWSVMMMMMMMIMMTTLAIAVRNNEI